MDAVEEWRSVPGYEGVYEVSSLGEVRSLDRVTSSGSKRRGRTLRPGRMKSGYLQVQLSWGGRVRYHLVHRLVLEGFVGPCPPGSEARHGNGVRDDNRQANLSWGTRSENIHDQVAHGTHRYSRRTACKRGHLLQGENLLPETERNKSRRCRACARERGRAAHQGRRFDDVQADEIYAHIMRNGASAGRTSCARGHLLTGGNIAERRRCRACAHARSICHGKGEPFSKEIADRAYARFISA